MKGKVKFFNRKKGFGFIQGEDGQHYFVHFTALPRGAFLGENDEVSFEVAETDRGKQAKNVVLESKGSSSSESYQGNNQESEETFGEESEEQSEEE